MSACKDDTAINIDDDNNNKSTCQQVNSTRNTASFRQNSSDINSYATLEQYGAGVMLAREQHTLRMSAAAADLLCHILVVDRGLRPRSAEALTQHPFFTAEATVS